MPEASWCASAVFFTTNSIPALAFLPLSQSTCGVASFCFALRPGQADEALATQWTTKRRCGKVAAENKRVQKTVVQQRR